MYRPSLNRGAIGLRLYLLETQRQLPPQPKQTNGNKLAATITLRRPVATPRVRIAAVHPASAAAIPAREEVRWKIPVFSRFCRRCCRYAGGRRDWCVGCGCRSPWRRFRLRADQPNCCTRLSRIWVCTWLIGKDPKARLCRLAIGALCDRRVSLILTYVVSVQFGTVAPGNENLPCQHGPDRQAGYKEVNRFGPAS